MVSCINVVSNQRRIYMKNKAKDLPLNWGDVAHIQEVVEKHIDTLTSDSQKAPYKEALEHLEQTMEAIVPFSSTMVPTN